MCNEIHSFLFGVGEWGGNADEGIHVEQDMKFKCQLHVELTSVRLAADKKKTEWPNKILSDIFSENLVLEYLCRRKNFISKGHKCLLGVVKKKSALYIFRLSCLKLCATFWCVCMGGRGEGS